MTNSWADKVKGAKVPTFYKALLLDAANSKPIKTSNGIINYNYSIPGYELARHIEKYAEEETIDQLFKILEYPDLVKNWLKMNLKRFYSLVPSKRKDIFLRGFIECLKNW